MKMHITSRISTPRFHAEDKVDLQLGDDDFDMVHCHAYRFEWPDTTPDCSGQRYTTDIVRPTRCMWHTVCLNMVRAVQRIRLGDNFQIEVFGKEKDPMGQF